VYLSYIGYIAENGLPFIPTYDIKVQVRNADELDKNADVRIGGARVGQVLAIDPEPATASDPHPYAQLQLQLEKSLEPLSGDTRYSIRLASILGGKYLELIVMKARTKGTRQARVVKASLSISELGTTLWTATRS
jgi:ABC-type transporter Mla subunit MlaD